MQSEIDKKILNSAEENGNGDDLEAVSKKISDEVVREYATLDHQSELARDIEAQELPVRTKLPILKEKVMSVAGEGGSGMLLFEGETGSGKSIYSPEMLLDVCLEIGLPERVLVLQPRRDAATGVALAVAALMNVGLGKEVGVTTSEGRSVLPDSKIVFMTPGIFLRHISEGTMTRNKVGAIMIDEAHEVSIEYDAILGFLKQAKDKGEAPLCLITSATAQKERITKFFGLPEGDYLKIEGRTYPVDVRYSPIEKKEGEREYNNKYLEETARLISKELVDGVNDGDILVFLPGMREIEDVERRVRGIYGKSDEMLKALPETEIIHLHGSLSPAERNYALKPPKGERKRRVILATNIAETSVTVPGVTLVIDSGRQRSVRYNPQSGITEKGTELISQAQAMQRSGRAGRLGPGKCVRVMSEEEFGKLREHPEAEMQKANLANIVLQLKGWGMNIKEFPFRNPPEQGKLDAAIAELKLLEALDENGELTALGIEIKDSPFEPRLARMLIEARNRGCLETALVMATALRSESGRIFLGPNKKDIDEAKGYDNQDKKIFARKKIEKVHNKFARGESDLLRILNVFAEAIDKGVFDASRRGGDPEIKKIQREFEAWCKENYLNERSLTHIAYKLGEYVKYLNRNGHAHMYLDRRTLAEKLRTTSDKSISAAILAGHPDKIIRKGSASRGMTPYYKLGESDETINLSPGSVTFNAGPPLAIAREISEGKGTNRGVEIKRNYANEIHPISPELLYEVFPHLVVRRVEEARYSLYSDSVSRHIDFRSHRGDSLGNSEEAVSGPEAVRAFAKALASGEAHTEFSSPNYSVIQKLTDLKNRSGGKVNVPDLQTWYEERLGNIASIKELNLAKANINLLLNIDDLCPNEKRDEIERSYPNEVVCNGKTLQLNYTYLPISQWQSKEVFFVKIIAQEKDLASLNEEDLPMIGIEGDGLKREFRTQFNWREFSAGTLTELKRDVKEYKKSNAWSNWRARPERKRIEISITETLPSTLSLGYVPLKYFRDEDGVLEAYPGITHDQGYNYDTGTYSLFFNVEYFQNADDAMRSSTQSEIVRAGELRGKQEQEEKNKREEERLRKIAEEPVHTPSPPLYPNYPTYNSYEVSAPEIEDQSLGSMADAFKRATSKNTAKPEEKIVRPVPKVEVKERIPEGPASSEEKRYVHEQLSILENLISATKVIGPRPKQEDSKKEKVLVALLNRAKELARLCKELEEEIAKDDARASVLKGKIANMFSSLETAWNRYGNLMIDGYDKNWIIKYEDLVEQTKIAINEDEMIQDALSNGSLKKLDLDILIKQIMADHAQDLQKGIPANPAKIVEEILDKITS